MMRAYGLISSTFLALALAGCGGSAAPVSPVQNAGSSSGARASADDVHVVVIDDAQPQNSYPHILLKVLPPANLGEPLADGSRISLQVTATGANGSPLSLSGATIAWSKPAQGSLAPDGQTAVYAAPATGQGSAVLGVTVVFPGQTQKYSGSATISYSSHG